jgi:hypothetical protein
LLTAKGQDAMDQLCKIAEELEWYRKRASLVAQIAGDAGGQALKDRQYLQAEYSETKLGKVISPISERVRARLEEIRSAKK